jgi:phage tail-like protein
MRGAVPGLRTPHPFGPAMPAMFQEDVTALTFVDALDEVLAPVPVTLDNLHAYLDPGTAPDDWLRYLARWVGVETGGSDTATVRRRVRSASSVQAETGTVAGVTALLRDAFDAELEVTDSGATTWSSTPGSAFPGEDRAVVRVRAGKGRDAALVRQLVAGAVPPYVEVEVQA